MLYLCATKKQEHHGKEMAPFKDKKASLTFYESMQSEALYDSMWKCRRGKMKKASVARYILHGIDETLKLEEQLQNGTYKPRKPKNFTLYYPKARPCSSIHFRDRVVQRSLNDNIVYPSMTAQFIWDNMACQKGKGTVKAMDRLSCFMRRAWVENGCSTEGLYVLQADIKGYYRNIRHDDAIRCFAKKLDADTLKHAITWLEWQYPNKIGYAPGSQMVQILGISFLNNLDHMIKESLKIRFYGRYMDDFFLIAKGEKLLAHCKEEIDMELAKIDMRLHPSKTRIYPLNRGIRFLGFTFRLSGSGKVYRTLQTDNIKHERRKLYRLVQLCRERKITKEKLHECYQSWSAHARKGNTKKLLRRMGLYLHELTQKYFIAK